MTRPTALSDALGEPLWRPTAARIRNARLTDFQAWLERTHGLRFDGYEQLWEWSIGDLEGFWGAIWAYFDILARAPYGRVLAEPRMPRAQWFTGAELNFVDQVFRHANRASPALIFDSEASGCGEVSWPQLAHDVASLAHTLRRCGVQSGDRVAAYLPNIPQTVVAFLATASVGAIWSVCAPDMGPTAVTDRFRQISPKVLIACDGYRFGGKAFDRRETITGLLTQLDTLQALIWVSHLDPRSPPPLPGNSLNSLRWSEAVGDDVQLTTDALPFDHPLWILYSSGTTGLPKAIVHGHGGVLVNGLVSTALHTDLRPGDRYFFSASTSWMVWNAHVMGLLVGSTLILYDGSVTGSKEQPDWHVLWRLAARRRVNVFGAGAAFYGGCLKAGITPRDLSDFPALDTVCATGSPLSPDGYHWIYDEVKADVWLKCSSGGTDIAGTFLCGAPTLPVYEGEMQCRNLGAAVYAFDDNGNVVMDEVGELVCTRAMPSMPLFFWDDPGRVRQLESYFETYRAPDGLRVWRHGDWLRLIARPEATGGIIYGRSDATINRQGVRMGTAELYRVVEAFEEVLDSLVVDLEYLGRESYMALFVAMRAGAPLTPALEVRLRQAIRSTLSARHVPDEILQVPEVPRTLTGKKLELPIKKLLLGASPPSVVNRDAMVNPSSIDWYVTFARRRLGSAS